MVNHNGTPAHSLFMNRYAFGLTAAVGLVAITPAFAQVAPPILEAKSLPKIEAKPRPKIMLGKSVRPVVIIGGWSNCPKHFTDLPCGKNTCPSELVKMLREQRGEWRVRLTTHADAWGDIDRNAISEAREIVTFMNQLNESTEFDLIGFSMGGLISRSILLKHSGELGRYTVKNLIMLGTPNHGANPVLTNLDPGVSVSVRGDDRCFPGHVAYNGTVASRQMSPDSAFLADLNARTIPASVRVTMIAGDMEVDVVTAGVEHRVIDSFCNANCSPGGSAIPVPSNRHLGFVDDWHGQCERKDAIGFPPDKCKKDTVCTPIQDRFQDGGVWKCREKIAIPTNSSARTNLGSDGFIRVASVSLKPSEAANVSAHHVFKDLYHTSSTRDRIFSGPNPKVLFDARGATPMSVGTPVLATPVDGTWFFQDTRVVETIRQIGAGS